MSRIQAFVFDMDGVIVNSNPLHRVAWEEYNRRHGIETTEAMQQRMYGKRNDAIVRDFFGEQLSPAEIFAHGAAKEALYREMLGPQIENLLVPGIRQFLERHADIPKAVATNAEPANLNFVLDQTGLRRYFRAAIDGHQVQNPKPDPEVFLRAADALGAAPENCVVFEDSHTGVRAGLAAGMRVVGLSTTHEELPGASPIISDFNSPALETWLAIQTLIAERDELKQRGQGLQGLLDGMGFPPGHYYSPLVDAQDEHVIRAVRERLSAAVPAGVRLDRDAMKATLRRLAAHHSSFPFPRDPGSQHRFYFDNPFFGCHDASVYFSMLLEFRPQRVIEIGCGFSSRLLLDTNDRVFNGAIDITLIDPTPATLPDAPLLNCPVQQVPPDLFDRLKANDILFIDSSHVGKTGSDVNYYLFEILPRLKPGVIVHIHDILYPFEYPAEWIIDQKRSWNEAYLVHAFLQYNAAFEILYWNNYVFHSLAPDLAELMPLCGENEGGSLWIRKLCAAS